MKDPTHKHGVLEKIENLEHQIAQGIARRLKITHPHFSGRPGSALLVFINGFITIAILAAVAMISGTPFIFPSLGPTAFLLFFAPASPNASPRNTLYGHALGILCGYGAIWLVGLQHAPSAMLEGVNLQRVLAAALSLGTTGALMVLFRVVHPPAGATTLIVSLGIITSPFHLLIIEAAVAIMVLQAIVINRLAGIDYPIHPVWSGKR